MNGWVEVIDEDFEVHHLCLTPWLLGPDRGLLRVLGLDVQADAAMGVADLLPARAVACGELPAEQLRVEGTERFGIGAIDGDRRQGDRWYGCHDASLASTESRPARSWR